MDLAEQISVSFLEGRGRRSAPRLGVVAVAAWIDWPIPPNFRTFSPSPTLRKQSTRNIVFMRELVTAMKVFG